MRLRLRLSMKIGQKEDIYWNKVAKKREANFNKKSALSHKKAWSVKKVR
jgi:hypothetical protein